MITFGMMNIVGSFTSCYLTTGLFHHPILTVLFVLGLIRPNHLGFMAQEKNEMDPTNYHFLEFQGHFEISRWIDEEEERLKSLGETSLQHVILDMSGK